MNKLPLILASSSQRRIDIMSSLGWKYESISPDIDETPMKHETAEQLVMRLAIQKAQVVSENNPGRIIIAADSVVEVDGRIYGKPVSQIEAEAMLKEIRGTHHRIHSGISICHSSTGNIRSHCVTTVVQARRYSDIEIKQSIDRGTPFDKAGAKELAGLFKAAVGSNGADVIYDAIGGSYAEASLRCIAWKGRFLVVGFPSGIPSIPLNLALLKGCQIAGVFWGAFTEKQPDANAANIRELYAFFSENKIRPHVSARYPLSEAAQAIKDLSERRAMGKIVVTI